MEAWWDQCWSNEPMEGNMTPCSWKVTHVPAGFSLESEIRRTRRIQKWVNILHAERTWKECHKAYVGQSKGAGSWKK